MSDKNEVAISVKGLTKEFKLPKDKHKTLKGNAISYVKRNKSYSIQKALKDVSFEVKKGEFFGIVGRNGSGKSTLLKCMAGVYHPTKGNIEINGTLVPFIELGVGFNPELTGRDNVFLNGALLGFDEKEMNKLYDEIVEFAELEDFMDQKLKNYSSGMQVRLAFSIAIQAKGEILLLDEVLAVGDSAFQKKCNDYFYELKKQKRTVILVTHSMGAVEEYCDKALLLDKGKISCIGTTEEVVDKYNELNLNLPSRINKDSESKSYDSRNSMPSNAEIVNIETYKVNKNNSNQNKFLYNENIGIRYKIQANYELDNPAIGLVFKNKNDTVVFATNTPSKKIKTGLVQKNSVFYIEFEVENIFDNGDYTISGAITSKDRTQIYHKINNAHKFEIGGWMFPKSVAHANHNINVKLQ